MMNKLIEEAATRIARYAFIKTHKEAITGVLTDLRKAIREEQRKECAEAALEPIAEALRCGEKYRLDGYIRWGLVERDMKRVILNAGKENSP